MLKKIFILLILINSFITGQTLKFHLDASDTNNMVYNGNSKITSITTSDANNYVFLQSDTSLAPTLVRNFQNGKPAIYCDGSRYLQKSDFPTTIDFGNDATFFIVFNLTAPTLSVPNQSYLLGTYNGALLGFDTQTGTNAYKLRINPGGGYLEKQIYTYKNRITSYAFNINSLNISQYFVNGLPYTGSTVSLSSQFQINEICGWHTPTGERHWYGYIYEIRIYTGTMTRTQIDSVNNVLGEKWDFNALKTIPYYNQHITGSGTSGDPYLIYNHQDMDSMVVIGGLTAKWALANDIDCTTRDTASHFNAFIDDRSFEGNGFTIKNLIVNRTINQSTFANESIIQSLIFGSLDGGANNVKIDSSRFNLHFELAQTFFTYRIGLFSADNVNAVGDSIIISNSALNVSIGALGDLQAFEIALMTTSNSVFTNSGVLNSTLVIDASQDDFFSFAPYAGIFTGNNSNTQSNKNFVYNCTLHLKGSKTIYGGLYGGRIVHGGCDTSYVRGTIINDNPATRLAGFAAVSNSLNTYDELYSAVDFNFIQNPISYSIFVNDPDGMLIASSYVDTTLAGFSQDASLSAYGTSVDYKSTTEMKTEVTFLGWDFDAGGNWQIDTLGIINNGYPYLQYFPPVFNFINITFPVEGTTYVPGDTIHFTWTASDSNVTISSPVNQVVTDTLSYSWLIPDTLNAGALSISLHLTDIPSISDQINLILLQSKFIEIDSVYPSFIVAGVGNDSLYIKTSSNNIPSIKYFYKNNISDNWIFFGQDSVEFIAGADTNIFSWRVTAKETDSLFIKVEEDRDTNLTSFGNPQIKLLGGYHGGGICWETKGEQRPFHINLKRDVSCGWVANIGWDIGGAGVSSNRSIFLSLTSYPGFTAEDKEVRNKAWNEITPSQISLSINGGASEIVPKYITLFPYNLYKDTSPFIWRGYRYTLKDDSIFVSDLVNGINNILYVDLKPYTTRSNQWANPYFSGTIYLGFYNFPSSAFVGGVDINNPFELNTPVTEDWIMQQHKIYYFTPFLIVYTTAGFGNGQLMTLNIAGDAYTKTSSVLYDTLALPLTVKRYYFRGIKPWANRHQRSPFNQLGN